MKSGFTDERWTFDLRELESGEPVERTGVWLTESPLGSYEGPIGDAELEVDLALSEETVAPFELEGIIENTRVWVVPAELLNAHSTLRIAEVDPRASGWHEPQRPGPSPNGG